MDLGKLGGVKKPEACIRRISENIRGYRFKNGKKS